MDEKPDGWLNTPLISVIIANYNYAAYVAETIESALALKWPRLEVIVVDDGSTDGSLEVIAGYADRIRLIRQSNQGQRSANNAGFAVARGDIVIFLDSDDLLHPAIAEEVVAVWSSRTSKVQVQMAHIGANGAPMGSVLPHLRDVPTPNQIREWVIRSAEYPTPPGSGNIYARAFLEAIFPLGADRDRATDSTCIAMAPFYGDVITIAKPLAYYRIHDANDSNMLRDDGRFGEEVRRASKRMTAARDASRTCGYADLEAGSLYRGCHLLQLRIASMRLRPDEHPLASDSRGRALRDALLLPFRSGFETSGRALLIAFWSVLTIVSPKPLARALIRRRFAAKSSGARSKRMHAFC